MSEKSKKKELSINQSEAKESMPLASSATEDPKPSHHHYQFLYSAWHGPLPSPEILKEYNKIVPGMAERLLSQFEAQGNHRRDLEKDIVKTRKIGTYLGQTFGFIVAISFLIGAVYVTIQGYPYVGTVLGSADIGGFVWAYKYGVQSQREERKQRRLEDKERIKKYYPSSEE